MFTLKQMLGQQPLEMKNSTNTHGMNQSTNTGVQPLVSHPLLGHLDDLVGGEVKSNVGIVFSQRLILQKALKGF